MASDLLKLIGKSLWIFLPLSGTLLSEWFKGLIHRWTWRDVDNAKVVVVLGGSFAGTELVKRLVSSLPTGCKVVWVEKNSHFNYSFVFPRYSVVEGLETAAFIPYDQITRTAPAGILSRIQDTAIEITRDHVLLASGDKVEYSYLAIATGSSQPRPVQASSTERDEACEELRQVQRMIKENDKIGVIGGGAVGVEISSDIKSFYPEKKVTLIHSRDQLMNRFGPRLQQHAISVLKDELKMNVRLNERPSLNTGNGLISPAVLEYSDGTSEAFDLVVSVLAHPCVVAKQISHVLT